MSFTECNETLHQDGAKFVLVHCGNAERTEHHRQKTVRTGYRHQETATGRTHQCLQPILHNRKDTARFSKGAMLRQGAMLCLGA